jgi:hypothetical protein
LPADAIFADTAKECDVHLSAVVHPRSHGSIFVCRADIDID